MNSLFKTLSTIFVLSSACLAMQAQCFEESVRPWTDGALRLEEFKGKVSNDSDFVYLNWRWREEAQKRKIGNVQYSWQAIIPYLDMTESWIRPSYGNAQTLKLSQTAFDLLEVYARQATIERYHSKKADFMSVARYYSNQYSHRFQEMQTVTKKGQDVQEMDLYAAGVALELQQPAFDPTSVPLGSLTDRVDFSVGVGAVMPVSSYFAAAPYGVNMALDCGLMRHLIGLDMGIYFGSECKKYYETKNRWVDEGESLLTAQMFLTYGYCLNPKSLRLFYPIVGIGVSAFDPTTTYPDEKDKNVTYSKSGFSMAAGFHYDLMTFGRRVFLSPDYGSTSTFYTLRLRPLVSLTNYGSGPGWVPSFQLSLQFNWGTASWPWARADRALQLHSPRD